MQSVHGYERKDPAIIRQLTTGYPRFVVHPFSLQLAQHFRTAPELAGRTLWLTSSARMATALVVHLGRVASTLGVTVPPAPFHAAGVHGVSHPDSPALAAAAKVYLQNCGGFLSAREAEDRLLALGLIPSLHPEETFAGDAAAEVHHHLRRVLPAATTLWLGDACQAPVAPDSQDLVLAFTVFSSLLDDAFQQRLADAMWRWVKPGGAVLWYDFVVDNPRNPDVRGVPLARVRQLFPQARLDVFRVTLAPPLARAVCRVHPGLYTLFNAVPGLRTHRLAWLGKPR